MVQVSDLEGARGPRLGTGGSRGGKLLHSPSMDARDQFRLLAGIALVDARLDAPEEQVLLRAAGRLGLGQDEATGIVRELMQGGRVKNLAAPDDPRERARLFQTMIELVAADGKVTPQEQTCLERMAPAFGVAAGTLPQLLSGALSGASGGGGGGSATGRPSGRPTGRKRKDTGEASCPSCGAPVEFKNTRSVAAVCEYCDTTVVREDSGGELKDAGKISHIVADASPIQIGATGSWNGEFFTVLGRLQIEHATGYWNEWFLEWADRTTGWLAEALGQYFVTFPQTGEKQAPDLPRFEELQVGQRLKIDNKRFVVTEVGRARATGTEGETPFVVEGGYELPFADLRCPDNSFGTIDYSDSPPLVFVGKAARWKDLNMRNFRRFDGWAV